MSIKLFRDSELNGISNFCDSRSGSKSNESKIINAFVIKTLKS